MVRPTVEYASTVWDPVNHKKHQIIGAGTEMSGTISMWRLSGSLPSLCYKYGKSIIMGNPTRSKENQQTIHALLNTEQLYRHWSKTVYNIQRQ